ncbi:TPA: arginase family protein [Vibrio vulnificus]|nr:arginase [Vibrio vulnificus]HDY8073492.1 arginase family protein [Vibrio vulnificus]
MISLQGHIIVNEADLEKVIQALPLHIELTRKEPGCLTFSVSQDPVNPCLFHVEETFTCQFAFDEHQRRTAISAWAEITRSAKRCYQVSYQTQVTPRARRYDIIGAPFNQLGCYVTSQNPVDQFRQLDEKTGLGLSQWIAIRNNRWDADINDCGDVAASSDVLDMLASDNKEQALALYSSKLQQRLLKSYQQGRVPITIGGDHSIAVGTVQATLNYYQHQQEKRVAVIWVDAHADCNNQLASNLHGKPIALLMNEYPHNGWQIETSSTLSPSDVYLIGVRDLMPAEQQLMTQWQITHYSMDMIEQKGIHTIVDTLLTHLDCHYDHIYLSFDYDALDGAQFRACATPNVGGLSAREALYLVRAVAAHPKFVGADFVEYLPELDESGVSKELMIKLIDSVWGFRQ